MQKQFNFIGIMQYTEKQLKLNFISIMQNTQKQIIKKKSVLSSIYKQESGCSTKRP